ncbi:hypothetical protein [Nocardiopsis composta]|uniref:Heme-degrading monooxygenase HmoA n=1 Tax=Nocardiopsis composta TaxID=157465 RepID=A0A7W8VH84_9ACTN|nr:hypothetical protein [Nocardiopsis composta]MBB5435925.1 heme-degrading monooxygenase HmoA [Nocardiopsis composta]
MPYLLIRQRFTDYDRWREAFDSLDGRRSGLGLSTLLVARDADAPDEAVVLLGFDDAERVRAHFPSPQLEEAHRRGGVVPGSTRLLFLDDLDGAPV